MGWRICNRLSLSLHVCMCVSQVMFTEEGEVRKVSEDLVHGVLDKGGVFVNRLGCPCPVCLSVWPRCPDLTCPALTCPDLPCPVLGASPRRAC